jgi:hypothetical protein
VILKIIRTHFNANIETIPDAGHWLHAESELFHDASFFSRDSGNLK